jgi:hypothetical protein
MGVAAAYFTNTHHQNFRHFLVDPPVLIPSLELEDATGVVNPVNTNCSTMKHKFMNRILHGRYHAQEPLVIQTVRAASPPFLVVGCSSGKSSKALTRWTDFLHQRQLQLPRVRNTITITTIATNSNNNTHTNRRRRGWSPAG